jgi:multiple sugar transport system permease protein
MIAVSFSRAPDFLSGSHPFIFTLGNYQAVLTSESMHFMAHLRNGLVVSSISSVMVVIIASFAAYAITRLSMVGKGFILFSVLAVSMFPQISLIGYLFKLMTNLGWINSYPALIFPYTAWMLPFSLWILVSYFSRIPRELDNAAMMDGCSRRQVLHKIIFPVAAPGFFATLILVFIFAFNEFMFALTLTTDHHARTIPVGIALFQRLHGATPWGQIMAASTISVVPVIILILIFQRRIIQGLTRGAVKG